MKTSQFNTQISNQITAQITQVCTEQAITCLHAIESGSRAWGFSSSDSDYDVRLIYCHQPDWYLRLLAEKDTFEYIDNELFAVPFDIGGWDIRKALLLLYKSNAVIFEWLNSPIIYQSDSQFLPLIHEVQQQFFNPLAIFYHYRGMAKTATRSLDVTQPIKLKKCFYLLRALLASVWTLEKQTPPPVLMADMFQLFNAQEQQFIEELMLIKQSVDESYQYQLPQEVINLVDKLWQWGDTLISKKETFSKPQGDIALLDDIFKKVVFNR